MTGTKARPSGGLRVAPRAGLRAAVRSPRVRAALALGVGASVAAAGTLAAWTDSAVIEGVSLQTGTVNLQVDEGAGAANWRDSISDSSVLDISGMLPTQSTAGIIKVRNAGTGALSTTLTATATSSGGTGGTLHNNLTVKVTDATSVTGSGSARTCGGATVAGSGTTLNSTLVPSWTLAGGNASRTFCVQITLDAAAPSTLQGASTTAALTFGGTT